MNALAQVFTERHCSMCKRLKPLEAFSPSAMRCLDCNRTYQRERNARIREGTWKPRGYEQRGRPFPIVSAPPPTSPVEPEQLSAIPGAAEASLRFAIEAFMVEFGFTALKVTYTRLEGEIARKHRLDIAREGWIA